MKTFRVKHKDFRKPSIVVVLHQPPYENENILNKTGWKEKDVKIMEIHNGADEDFKHRDSSIDEDYIGDE